MTNRTNFYIDGFNIYHRICDYDKKTGNNYRWLNYRSLCEKMLHSNDTLGDIYFFTAIANFCGSESIERHKRLIDALKSYDIKIISGYFDKKRKEKQTDVNIATQIIVDAALKRCQKIFLFSGDNDFAPALQKVAEVAGENSVRTIVMTPPYQGKVTRPKIHRLREAVNGRVVEITFNSLCGHALPPKIETPRGITILMPKEYKTF